MKYFNNFFSNKCIANLGILIIAVTLTNCTDQSTENLPINIPKGFIFVPGDPDLGTEDFYVSKYEMKIYGMDNGDQDYNPDFTAESRASGTPWINLTLQQAREECAALGDDFHLITNAEWMTIARNIEKVAANWSDNQTHLTGMSNAYLNVGHSCRQGFRGIQYRKNGGSGFTEGPLAASIDDNDGLYGLLKADFENQVQTLNSNGWNVFRRTHFLTTGDVIWDFSGNVWDWVDWYIPNANDRVRIDKHIDDNYLEINACNSHFGIVKENEWYSLNRQLCDLSFYTGANYFPEGEDQYGLRVNQRTNLNRLGRYHPTKYNNTAGAAMRGGSYTHGDADNGIYALGMGYGENPGIIKCEVGFRCVWKPKSINPLKK